MKVDKNGYYRGKLEHSNLIHRQKAYKYIYLPNRHEYPLNFSEYVVHHIDHNKKNNDISNLEILTPEEHDYIHGYVDGSGEDGLISVWKKHSLFAKTNFFVFCFVVTFFVTAKDGSIANSDFLLVWIFVVAICMAYLIVAFLIWLGGKYGN